MKISHYLAVVSATLLSALAVTLEAQIYQITDLGPLSGAPTFATAITDNSIVAGYALPTEASLQALP